LEKNKKYENILIIEDDCFFKDDIKNVDDYFKFIPDNWDMLYFGGNHQLRTQDLKPIQVNEKIIKVQNTLTSHCVAINKKLFEVILIELKKFVYQTDVVYRDIQKKYNVYSFFPSLATQSPGFSDIQNHNVNYDSAIY